MSAFLAAIGADISFGLNVIFGPGWQSRVPEIALRHGPWIAFLTAALLLLRLVHREFFSHRALKSELEKAISNLSSANNILRTHAIQDILEVSRKSRRLHLRAMNALAQHLRECAPAPEEPDRTIELKKQRFSPPSANVTQKHGQEFHKFAQQQHRKPIEQLSTDAAAVIEAFANRRRFFDDPRRWIDLSFTDLPSGNFEGGNFNQFSFVGANLRHAHFEGANVARTAFDGAILNDAFFTRAKATKASFAGCMAHRIHFDEAKLSNTKFLGADLYDVSIQKADAKGADFMAAQMWRASGGLTDFKGATFFKTNLQGADFHAAKNLTKDQIEGMTGAITDKNTRLPWSSEDELHASGLVRIKRGKG